MSVCRVPRMDRFGKTVCVVFSNPLFEFCSPVWEAGINGKAEPREVGYYCSAHHRLSGPGPSASTVFPCPPPLPERSPPPPWGSPRCSPATNAEPVSLVTSASKPQPAAARIPLTWAASVPSRKENKDQSKQVSSKQQFHEVDTRKNEQFFTS